ncbi:MAG: VCBS repeat-containing protein [Bacteroidetes bacterium]|nr:VCBS repeat-containing protein [Bacteroidota bacterium]
MKKVLTVVLILFATKSWGQNFEDKFHVATPFALSNSKIQWVDANNDSLLDVMIVNSAQGEIKLTFMRNLGTNSFSLAQTISTGYQNGSFFLTDFDKDNHIDIVISGRNLSGTDGTEVFLNKGNFSFQKTGTKIQEQAYTEILFADLNNDGSKDMVASDANGLYLFEQRAGQFILRMDTSVQATSIKSYDFDSNGFHDIAFSGLNSTTQPTTATLLLKDKFKILSKVQVSDVNGSLEAGDLNHDGLFDLIVAGRDSAGSQVIRIFQNNDTSFVQLKAINGLDTVAMKIADFNSDGKADIGFLGKKSNLNPVSWIKTFTGDSISVAAANVKAQDYGDYDRDGDLDLVQLRGDSIVVFKNNLSAINKGPVPIVNPLGVQIYNRTFFYWKKPTDDHTDSTSVTYDLKVYDSSVEIISSEYDKTSMQRLLVSHGNLGTANYSIQRIARIYQYEVQSIDNSFVAQKVYSGSCSRCVNITAQNITMCSPGSSATLKPSSPKAMWFSFSKGYLGIHDSLSLKRSESDTIFSFNPSSNPSCSSIKLFNIKVSTSDTLKVSHNIWNCEGSQNVLTIDSEWKNVTWKNNLNATVSIGNQLPIILKKQVVFNAFGSNTHGCHLKETFNLNISKPNLKLADTQYQIAKGGSVQLSASGGDSYNWSPSETLNDATISSPTASPSSTTEYTVVATDTIGCTASAKIVVEVMESGFIPTLFTPNGDGKNDELRIFGLSTASNFRFTIYNREGNVMFDTNDVVAATHRGWSGISNGQSQPSGTYYWKVEGNNNLGEQLTLNGKKSGAFLLVR